jgi:toxin FitB
MKIIDSSLWIEFYNNSIYSDYISEEFRKTDEIIVPTIIIVEVFKKLLSVINETTALNFIAQMKKCKIVDLNFDISLNSAYLGKEYKLPLADSIIYATALYYNATLFTLDKHFKDLPNVQYFEKIMSQS